MPTTAPAPTPTPTPAPTMSARYVRAGGGRLHLEIDVRVLHAYLDLLGVPVENGRYADAPATSTNHFDTYAHKLNAHALLLVPPTGEPLRIPLGASYRNPVPKAALESIARSIPEAVAAVIEHYRPVTIRVEIALKPALAQEVAS